MAREVLTFADASLTTELEPPGYATFTTRYKEGLPLSEPREKSEENVTYWTNLALAKHTPGKDEQRLMGEARAGTPVENIPDEWFAKAGRALFATMCQVVPGVRR